MCRRDAAEAAANGVGGSPMKGASESFSGLASTIKGGFGDFMASATEMAGGFGDLGEDDEDGQVI